MLNALEPGTIIPIYRHQNTSETMVILRGRLVGVYCSEDGLCTETIEMYPDGAVMAVNIVVEQWHSLRVLESGTVILEMKNGPYVPIGPEDILK